jgi:hypothetical protein
LIRINREEWLPLLDNVTFLNVDLSDCSVARDKYLGGSRRRREIAYCGFLSNVAGKPRKRNKRGDNANEEPNEDSGWNRLESGDVTPLLPGAVKVDRLLAK